MSRLTLLLLGPLQIMLDGQPLLGFKHNKARALLCFLAVEAERPQQRTALADLLWPDESDERAALTDLRQVLLNLTQLLGKAGSSSSFISTTRDSIQFNPASDYSLDAQEFTGLLEACEAHRHRHIERCAICIARLEQAMRWYRGDFLEQFVLKNSEPFEVWALEQRSVLHRRAVDALGHLVNHYERLGDDDKALRHVRRLAQWEPWQEEAQRALMRILTRQGKRGTALKQYALLRQTLRNELNIEPEEETAQLYRSIRDTKAGGSFVGNDRLAKIRHLPEPPGPIIGRSSELVALGELLVNPDCRLVTVIGPGGIGKTRLALEAATIYAIAFRDGVTFVSLAALNETENVALAIMGALEVMPQGRSPAANQLLAYLRDKELLLILDNYEHLIAKSNLVDSILQRAPQVVLLVTSRERLAVRSEHLFDLHGLQYPTRTETQALDKFSAVQLFTQRAIQAQTDFSLEGEEALAVARICRLVEGFPLALELAAGAIRHQTSQQIADAIERSAQSLTSSLRDYPERHRSIWATFDYSWHALSRSEREVLMRVSIFRGGFDLEAARSVALASDNELKTLADKSLLRQSPGRRFEMHELIRQFSYERLVSSGESASTKDRHLEYFVTLAEAMEPHFFGPEQPSRFKQLRLEQENLRVAMSWSEENPYHYEKGLQLAGALWMYWELSGQLSEGRRWLVSALNRTPLSGHSLSRARALNAAGKLAWIQGDLEDTRGLFEQALVLWNAIGHEGGRAQALFGLGRLEYRHNAHDSAQRYYEESLALCDRIDDQWGLANALVGLGQVAIAKGNVIQAIERHQKALIIRRALQDRRGTAWSLRYIANLSHRQGNLSEAEALYRESLEICRDLGDRWGTGAALKGLGIVAVVKHDYAVARTLYEESLAINREVGAKGTVIQSLIDLGDLTSLEGDFTQAVQLYSQSLRLAQEMGTSWEIAWCLESLAGAAAQQGDATHAVRILTAVEHFVAAGDLRTRIGNYVDHDHKMTLLRSTMSAADFVSAESLGRKMSMKEVIEFALNHRSQ